MSLQDSIITYWKENGAAPEKLIVGFPAYGHTFMLSDPSNTGIGAPTISAGPPGKYTGETGLWAYYEVSILDIVCSVNYRPISLFKNGIS